MSVPTLTVPKPLDRVSAPALQRALRAGIARVLSRREHLNRINVFPVPDGDTGSNLSFTLHAVLGGALRGREAHAGALLARVAEHAIDGARGNSGAILAQFLQGASEAVADVAVLQSSHLAAAASAGSRQAREALSEPREGTILSVIQAFAAEIHAQVQEGIEDLRVVMAQAVARARVSLADTPRQLAVLRSAGVVDAGAQGFVDMVEGMLEFLERGRSVARIEPVAETAPAVHADVGEPVDPEHRFCTECMVSGDGVDRPALRAALAAMDAVSVVIAGTRDKVRIHAHVADPARLFEVASAFGSVSARKADDMLAQTRSRGAGGGQVAIVTDSGADLPDYAYDELGIHVVPVRLSFGETDYLDKVSLSSEAFYRELRTNPEHPRTSQPPPGDFRRVFDFLLSHHKAVLSVNLSRRLSGTLQSAEAAAERLDPDRLRVIDTENAAAGEGLVVMYAAEAARAGLDADQVARVTRAIVPRTRTFAVLPDLKYAVRGGRLKPGVRRIADLLRLTPVLTNRNGQLKPAGALLGRSRLPARFAAWVARRIDGELPCRLLVGHGGDPDAGAALRAALVQRVPLIERADLVATGSAVGAHAGPGALVVAVQAYTPPELLIEQLGA
jgi:DegV family protein with EDD domain